MASGLLDTSVLMTYEVGRPVRENLLPESAVVSAVTVAELTVGALAADDDVTRARRLRTLRGVDAMQVVDTDARVGTRWAELRIALAAAGRRANMDDLWIAATALEHELPVVTQEDDFDVLAQVSDLEVIHV